MRYILFLFLLFLSLEINIKNLHIRIYDLRAIRTKYNLSLYGKIEYWNTCNDDKDTYKLKSDSKFSFLPLSPIDFDLDPFSDLGCSELISAGINNNTMRYYGVAIIQNKQILCYSYTNIDNESDNFTTCGDITPSKDKDDSEIPLWEALLLIGICILCGIGIGLGIAFLIWHHQKTKRYNDKNEELIEKNKNKEVKIEKNENNEKYKSLNVEI